MEQKNNHETNHEQGSCLRAFFYFALAILFVFVIPLKCAYDKDEEVRVEKERIEKEVNLLKNTPDTVVVINTNTTIERNDDWITCPDGVAVYSYADVSSYYLTYVNNQKDTLTYEIFSEYPKIGDTIRIVLFENKIRWWEKVTNH